MTLPPLIQEINIEPKYQTHNCRGVIQFETQSKTGKFKFKVIWQ